MQKHKAFKAILASLALGVGGSFCFGLAAGGYGVAVWCGACAAWAWLCGMIAGNLLGEAAGPGPHHEISEPNDSMGL